MRKQALVVGINSYPFLKKGDLKTPATDAEKMARLLEKYGGFNVTRLPALVYKNRSYKVAGEDLEVELKKEGLEKAIENLFNPSDEKPDIALLYFQGHGWKQEDQGYLCTSDTYIEEENYGLPLKFLRKQLETSEARQQIVFLDCCYSGELFNFQTSPELENTKNVDRCLIAASRSFQEAYEAVFSPILLNGLDPTRKDTDELVNNYQLEQYIRDEFRKKNVPQHPVIFNQGERCINLTSTGLIVPTDVCPYRSLNYFTEHPKDTEVFFGREQLTDRLIEKVKHNNFVVVIGASGSGKSSLLRAGLLYQLKLGQKIPGSHEWHYSPVFRPSKQPAENLKNDLENTQNQPHNSLSDRRNILIIDQFEECFTEVWKPEEREKFFEFLHDFLEKNENICLVLGIRADFWGKLAQFTKIADRIQEEQNLLLVKPLSEKEIEEVITKPAEKVGLRVEAPLTAKLTQDVIKFPGSLPLLEDVLTELWQKNYKIRKENDSTEIFLTRRSYDELGGIKGTLQKRADNLFNSLNDEEKKAAKCIFLELTHIGEDIVTKRRVSVEKLLEDDRYSSELLRKTIDKLVADRLIVSSQEDERSPDSQVILDLIHDSLIEHWEQLKQWIENNKKIVEFERKIENKAEKWHNNPNDRYLLQGEELTEAEVYLKKYGEFVFSKKIVEFIEKSLQKRRNNRLQRIGIIILIIVILSGTSIFSIIQAQIAKKQTDIAKKQTEIANSRAKHLEEIEAGRKTLVMKGHTSRVNSVVFSPDGNYIASASRDNTVRLWSKTGNQLAEMKGHKSRVNSVVFSPDGNNIASASSDNTVRLWSKTGHQLAVMKGHTREVTSVVFSPDGNNIASASSDNTVRLWSKTGNQLAEMKGHTSRVNSVVFSPDGNYIASASYDNTVRLWVVWQDSLSL